MGNSREVQQNIKKKKRKKELPNDPAISPLDTYKGNKILFLERYLHVHCSIAYNSQRQIQPKCPLND